MSEVKEERNRDKFFHNFSDSEAGALNEFVRILRSVLDEDQPFFNGAESSRRCDIKTLVHLSQSDKGERLIERRRLFAIQAKCFIG